MDEIEIFRIAGVGFRVVAAAAGGQAAGGNGDGQETSPLEKLAAVHGCSSCLRVTWGRSHDRGCRSRHQDGRAGC
ncbi:hypothetical protein D3C72_1438700 [compost metagenome]